ncbi:MAG: molybdopterin synthase sulfur carrier subunit [Candidatus Poriferisodalaceae bacterium]|jgi:molybdopterin synthase sulfur carrier subunit|nr:MoaD/ThiS family protein [Acidimicrobiales bacterium]|tara:strand:+ start:10438 stop:10713 length:276 start_codon:yes stop_codon:yes gene_type:complete
MSISVRLPTVLRPHANGEARLDVDGGTVGEIIDGIVRKFPGMATNLLDQDGSLHRFVNVYVNDEDVRYLEKMETAVVDGDELSILPAVAGG